MALYEFHCEGCGKKFEQITSSTDPDQGKCPSCGKADAQRLISKFAVAGRGDLRESTMHGCHDCSVAPGPVEHSPDHGHDHDHSHD
jgi:putative FmdB family regulatory protein